jgi:hypothetical protein
MGRQVSGHRAHLGSVILAYAGAAQCSLSHATIRCSTSTRAGRIKGLLSYRRGAAFSDIRSDGRLTSWRGVWPFVGNKASSDEALSECVEFFYITEPFGGRLSR